jgi:hypothetical protein
MTIDEVDKKTEAGFKDVRAEIKDLRAEMHAGFGQAEDNLQAGFRDVRAEMQAGFKQADDNLQAVRAEIKTEGDITRRHFDVVAEQFKDYTKLLADGIVRNTERLDEHDRRITALEGGQ